MLDDTDELDHIKEVTSRSEIFISKLIQNQKKGV